MPLEIDKLYVNVSVNQAKSEGGEGSSTPASERDAGKKPDPDKVVKEAIEQVLKIMEDKKER